ncbi:MAG: CoB--CoM heterodisulfide reductase iron-sulfur subunit A family protein [Desulfamplus sp.]|nr:CoB--CoM heterodisulfide reductase iron-sulfur subunit A family protein [Desulfamplus sp.]
MQFIHPIQEIVRTGVFICHCGSNIAGIVDCRSLTKYCLTLPGVVHATDNLYTCSEAGIRQIMEAIKNNDLNRVVVASCSPRTHQPLFQSACKEAGLNPYLFEMVNIREQCSWVHAKDLEGANKKSRDLVRMGVAKASFLKPMIEIESSLVPAALVIGGGVAGLSAATAMAGMGLRVFLVEKEPQPGGLLNNLYSLASEYQQPCVHHLSEPEYQSSCTLQHFSSEHQSSVRHYIDDLIKQTETNPDITVYTSSQILSVTGYIGNFEFIAKRDIKRDAVQNNIEHVAVQNRSQDIVARNNVIAKADIESYLKENTERIRQKVGCIIVATGAVPYQPDKEFGYNGSTVITQMELERSFLDNTFKSDRVVMIQCVGSRTSGREYCSKICCMTAVKNAMVIKQKKPDSEIHILYRDMQMYGVENEKMLWDARGAGIRFYVYNEKEPPVVENGVVGFYDPLMGEFKQISCDLTVLSTPLTPSKESGCLAKIMKLPVDHDGFFLEAHAKLRPLDFSADGIFVCGSARYPATSMEARAEGLGAASRAASVLFRERLVKSAIVAKIDSETCVMCEDCLKICPFEAITRNPEKMVCQINPILCKGCGCCAAACPSQSVTLAGFEHQQLFAQIRAIN